MEGTPRVAQCPGKRRSGARGGCLWTHLGKPGSWGRLLLQLRGLDETGTALLAQAIAVAADGDDLAVVEEAIEDRDRWGKMMRASIEMSQWGFSSHRMVRDYFYNLYRAAVPGAVPVG